VNESFATGIQVEDGFEIKNFLFGLPSGRTCLPKQSHISNSRLEIVTFSILKFISVFVSSVIKFNVLKFISAFISSVVLCEVEST
jgi:hypothetical protein